jgi:hypothetical protein
MALRLPNPKGRSQNHLSGASNNQQAVLAPDRLFSFGQADNSHYPAHRHVPQNEAPKTREITTVLPFQSDGAGDGDRTRDVQLGKLAERPGWWCQSLRKKLVSARESCEKRRRQAHRSPTMQMPPVPQFCHLILPQFCHRKVNQFGVLRGSPNQLLGRRARVCAPSARSAE